MSIYTQGIIRFPSSCLFSEFVINPNGKSEVCILHEYMQRVLKVRPVYNFFECGKFVHAAVITVGVLLLHALTSIFDYSLTENPSEPFGASVIIDGVTYGTGTASSKKLAKNKAGMCSVLNSPEDISL